MLQRIAGLLILFCSASWAQEGTRMLRYPDVHGTTVVFAYAGDLWLAPVDGSELARRLTTHPGLELYPRFSPDGRQVAFAGQYRGDEQVYVIDIDGGEPRQLTYYPTSGPLPARWGTDHQVYGWSPDGSKVLFRSMRQDFGDRRLYQVSVSGGLPQVMPMPRAGSGHFSPDGKQIVYSPLFRDFRTWKRYQGGWAQNLFIYDLEGNTARQITEHVRTERDPVWLDSGIHYVSDRDGTLELFRYEVQGNRSTQLTQHEDWDIKWASGDGQQQIVYEIAGTIGLFDASSGTETLLSITVPDDHVRRTRRRIEVADNIEDFDLSPDGSRALIVARGDVFTVPVEHGVTRNLTRLGSAHDREAAWSPDGRHVAFVSDRSGEEQIYHVPHNGGEAVALTESRAARLDQLRWSPDSASIAYRDHTGQVRVVDMRGRERNVVKNPRSRVNDYVWSPDSQFLAFSQQMDNGFFGVYLWSASEGDVRLVSDGFFNSFGPDFGVDGQHLYFIADREFAPQIGSFEWNYVVDRESGVYALALNEDSGNPFGPRNDEVSIKDDEDDDDGSDDEDSDAGPPAVKIDFDGLAQRLIRLPIEADNIQGVQSIDGALLYLTGGPFYYGRSSDVSTTLHKLDIESRKSEQVASDLQGLAVSHDGKYVLVRTGGAYQRLEIDKPKDGKKLNTDNLIVYRAPAEEWPVIFAEVWRRFRDYFYVRNLHGYDWAALAARYRPLVAHVSTREDLNTLMGEMIAELNVGHAYVSGGDLQAPHRSSAALLGATFTASRGHYRIDHIYPGHNAEPKYRSPLTEVGVDISEGDYVLAIDGRALSDQDNPYDFLTDRGNQPVELLVNDRPSAKGARRVLVNPISDETNLVYLQWVERNRQYVAEQSDGQVGYLHIPDMGSSGIYEFIKWYYPQLRKQGLVIDVRGNGGGNVSQIILRRLMLKPMGFGYQAHSDWVDTYPNTTFNGHMVALLNEDSASDGDIFPYYFRKAGLGPLIGKRSWGGVVGITGHGPVIDGGQVFVPEFGIADADEGWVVEGKGVSPDIEIDNDPTSSGDAQLDRGIAEVLKAIDANPPQWPARPADPVKLN